MFTLLIDLLALDLATNSRVFTADNARTVNDIYLATIAKDENIFTPAQSIALHDLAIQCPMAGGTAVYRARALYSLIDDEQDYDDASACLPFGIVYRGMEQTVERVVEVVPNPAMDQAQLICTLEEGQSVTLVLYDATGREMQRHLFHWDRGDMSFSVTGLSSGTYHYVVSDNNGLVGDGKLSIMH